MFEFDPAKSVANKAKHGIDFDEAQALWNDEDAYAVYLDRMPEMRWALIARMRGRHWCMIFTRRNANIRIISVRRARTREIEAYERSQENQR